MPSKNHKALDRKDQNSKRLTPHTYTKGMRRRRETTWGEGEWEASTEKPNPKLETRNNLISPKSIHRGNHYVNMDLQTWRKEEPPEMRELMKAATRWENREGRGRRNKISKSWNRPRAMKEIIEVRSPKTRSWKPRRVGTIDGRPTTRKTTSKTTKLWPNLRRCSS